MSVTQRNNNRSQSTADYEFKKIFIFDNRFASDTLVNNSNPAVDWNLQSGQVVYRAASGFLSLETTSYSKSVGILKIDGTVTLASTASLTVDYCTKGTVDGKKLVDVSGNTLDLTGITDGLMLKDHLENMGIHVDTSSVEHTNFDN